MTNYIWITTSFEGIHKYPDAPEEVYFLRNDHRHMFGVKIYIEVMHDDRDIEFIIFKRQIDKFIKEKHNLDFKSCEMIADEIYYYVSSKYPNRKIKIEVNEDGENGCEKQYF